MPTSNTTNFNLDFVDLVEEAYERVGVELRTGYELRTARRSLNLLTIEWANRGINLWTIEQGSVSLSPGGISYILSADAIDLMDCVIRTGTGQAQTDINITRISASTYASIPNKNATGRPIQVWIDRRATAPTINVWPAPDDSQPYTFVFWRLRRIQDAGNGGDTQDIPFRFLPCMVAGLAYYIAMKIPEAAGRLPVLKAIYDEQWQFASDEDREKAALRIAPRQMYT